MFSRRDLPLDGSALLDDIIVSELAARRPAPITDPAVGLLAALVAAVDSRPIPDARGAYDWVLDLGVAERTPMPVAHTAEPSRLPAPSTAAPTPPPAVPIAIHRTWDGPRHRRNRPARRRVTSSVAVVSVVATTVGVSGVAAAVGGDPLRPFHSVATRVWQGVAGGARGPDARQGVEQTSQVGSGTRGGTKHRQASAAPIASHLHPVRTTRVPSLWPDAPSEGLTATGPYAPGVASYPTLSGFPVHSGGGGAVVRGTVTGWGGSNEPGQPSGPVWEPTVGLPSGWISLSHLQLSQPPPTVQDPTP
jgi:hypothetical protein